MGKPTICIGENKGADQLRGADQRLCFRYSDSTIPPLLNSIIASVTCLLFILNIDIYNSLYLNSKYAPLIGA